MSSSEKTELYREIEALKADNAAKIGPVQTLQAQLLKLDARLDSMQNELDLKT